MTGNRSLFTEGPRHKNQQRYDEAAKNCTGNDDVFAHSQSLFQFPFFHINQIATFSPSRTNKTAINIPISHSMRFPIPESKTFYCKAMERM